MRAEELKGHLDALLLAALEAGPRHGYAVIEALRQDTGGRLDLPTGTIYPALRRLEQAGLIAGSWSVVAGRRRRCYRLTATGQQTLAGRRAAWREVAAPGSAGLEETYRRHLGLGLAPDAAAAVAVAEFGAPELIAAEFARAHPARRAARRLLVTGPVVGSCWAVALITSRAWTWPVPMAADLVPGLALVAVVALLAFAARSTRYRPIGRAGAAGCIGTAALDAFMIIGVLAAGPAARWAVAVAITASAARLALNVRLVRPVLAGNGLHESGQATPVFGEGGRPGDAA